MRRFYEALQTAGAGHAGPLRCPARDRPGIDEVGGALSRLDGPESRRKQRRVAALEALVEGLREPAGT